MPPGDGSLWALREPPQDDLRVIVMLPRRANNGQDDTRRQVSVLADADAEGGGRFLATTIRARTGRTSDRMYVHAAEGHPTNFGTTRRAVRRLAQKAFAGTPAHGFGMVA